MEDIDEPEEPESDPELEALIRELIAAKYAAVKGSAEYLMVMRQLAVCATLARWQARSWKTWIRLVGALCARVLALLTPKERC